MTSGPDMTLVCENCGEPWADGCTNAGKCAVWRYGTGGAVSRGLFLATRTAVGRTTTPDERALLREVVKCGAAVHPIVQQRDGGWVWGPWRSLKGDPTVFKTKREAMSSFARHALAILDALREGQ